MQGQSFPRRLCVAAAALIISGGAASAVDLYKDSGQPDIWTGFYTGVHGGYGFGEHDGQPVYDAGDGPYPGLFAPGTIDVDGYLAGVTLGAQRQYGSIVLGVEIDGSWGDVGGEATFDAAPGGKPNGYHWTIESQVDNLYTARGRVGYATGDLLLFGTAGLAFAQVGMDETVTADDMKGGPTALASSEENLFGWAAGGGFEYAFAPQWSFKAEALYVNLGEVENRFKGIAYPGTKDLPHTTDSYEADLDLTVVRAGVNYRW